MWVLYSLGRHLTGPERPTDLQEEDTELIVAGFPLYKGGKVPEYVAKKADTWLRRHVRDEPRILKTLSFPSPAEEARKAKLK